MEKSWENMTNDQIFIELKELQQKHERLKTEIIQKYDELEEVEKKFEEGNKMISGQLKNRGDG